jgi:hypothetical protein
MSEAPTPLHVRTIRVEAVEDGGDSLLVTGTLVDERPRGGEKWFGVDGPRIIHQMRLGLRVRHPDLVITEVTGGMEAHPYRVCPEALPPLQQLVGVSVARGFTRAVNERLGRERGCAHLTALIHAMAPVVKQAAGVAFQPVDGIPADEQGLWVIDTCQAWRDNGPLHRLVRAGDIQGLQDISAYRRDGRAAPGP